MSGLGWAAPHQLCAGDSTQCCALERNPNNAGASGLPRRCGSLAPLFSGFGDAAARAPCRSRAAGPGRRAFLFSFCVAESRAGRTSKAPSLRAVRLRASETGPAPGALRDGRIQSCRAPAPLPRKETQQAPFPATRGLPPASAQRGLLPPGLRALLGRRKAPSPAAAGPHTRTAAPAAKGRDLPRPSEPRTAGRLRCLREG